MRLRVIHSVIAGGLVAACAQVSRPPREIPLPAPAHAQAPARVVQVDYGREAKFVACVGHDCPAVTPKTIAVIEPAITPTAIESPLPPPVTAAIVAPKRQSVTVEFPFGGTALNPRDQSALVTSIPVARRATRIVINGRTDNVGPESANNELALRRAIAVRNFLRQRLSGSNNVIVIESKGSCCYVAENDSADGRARNRRVEIEFQINGDVS